MRVRGVLVGASIVLGGVIVWAAAAFFSSGGPVARNVILISLDTLRADHLGLYGHELDTSPELDRFARSSFVFDRVLASSPNTPPSHASIMTSLYPGRHGFTGLGDRLDPQLPTLAEELERAGYRTGAFVDGGYLRKRFGLDRGFEVYSDEVGGLARIWLRAQRWLAAADDRPFFLFLHCYDIHTPYVSPPPFDGMFHAEPYTGDFVATSANLQAVWHRKRAISDEDMAHIRASYDEGIRYTDAELGKILRYLEERGLLEETLVVITSDHGEEFGEHGSVLHWQLYYQPNLRVPLVVRVPGNRRRGVTFSQGVQLIDLAPTILELLGLPPFEGAQGRSLAPALRRGRSAWQYFVHSALVRRSGPEPAFAWWSNPHHVPVRSALHGRYQLIFNEKKTGGELLFDVVDDPMAQNDLASERPELVSQIREVAMAVMRENRTAPPERVEALDSETRRELEALGYIE